MTMTKVMIGLSGGVDSAVAAYLLKKQGYDVIAGFMRNWDSMLNNDFLGNPNSDADICPQEQDYNDAKKVADKLGIPLLLASMFVIPLIINRVDYKLCYIEEGKITEMYDKMVVINNESRYLVRDTNDIATRNMLNLGDSVFLYSYNSGIFGSREDVFVSSVFFDDDVINHGNTYPEVFWKTFGIYLLMCIFWGVIFSIKGIYKRI